MLGFVCEQTDRHTERILWMTTAGSDIPTTANCEKKIRLACSWAGQWHL